MSPLDWIILAVYCASVLGLALYFQKRASQGLEEFFIAGRDLPWWVIGFADVAGYTGGGQGFVMLLFLSGFSGLWLMAWLSWVIWMPLVAVLWAPMWRRLGVVTTGEFIEKRYAGRIAKTYRSIYAVYACSAWGVTAIAYAAAWMAATVSPMLGWSPAHVLLIFGALTILYTLLAGLFAVAYNDVMQFFVLMGGNLAFGLLLISKSGGMHATLTRLQAIRGTEFLSALPGGKTITAATLIALVLQGLFFAGSPFAGEGWTAQRFMAARDERHAVLGQMSNGVLALVVRLIPFIVIAFGAAAIVPLASATAPATLWGDLARRYAPPGLFGLLLISSLAGYMAAISSIGNWAASYVVNDVYRRSLRPKADQKELVLASRTVTGLLLGLAFVLGAFIRADQLDKWIIFINSSLIVFSLPLAWLKWFWWRTNAVGDMVGVLGGFPVGYVVWFGSDAVLPSSLRGWLQHAAGINLSGIVPAFSDLNRYPFWMGFSLLFASGWIAILTATMLTRPEPMETLRTFYKTAKPPGLWGHVRRTLSLQEAEDVQPALLKDLAAGGFGIVFYFSLTVALFSGMAGHFRQMSAFLALALVSGWLFGRKTMRRLRTFGKGTESTP